MKMKNIWIFTLIIPLFMMVSCDKQLPSNIDEEALVIDNSLTNEEIEGGILTPEILWKFNRIGGAVLSPDGENVVFSMTKYSLLENKGQTHLYTIPAVGGEYTQVTEGNASCYNPEWIENGSKIAFLTADEDGTQMWSMNPDGTNLVKRTKIEGGINYFDVSPDGSKILWCQDVKMDKNATDVYPDLPKTNVHMTTSMMFRHWNHWEDGSYSHIVYSNFSKEVIESGNDIMKDEAFDAPLSPYFDFSEISWSPKAKYIAYTCKKMKSVEYATSTNSEIYLYNCENEKTENISAPNPGYDKYPVFSNNGQKIAWQQMKIAGYESDRSRLVIYDIASKKTENVTEDFDHSVTSVNWNSDDSEIYFITGFNATYQVCKINLDTKSITTLTEGWHNYNSIELVNGKMLATRMSMSMAVELFVLNLDGEDNQLTHANKFIYDNIEMGEVREEWVETTDGKKMLVWLILPPNFDESKKYPAILYCQGGPQSAVSQFFSYRWNFQIMAANGYVVIAPNRRGLPSFGSEWNEQISGDYGGQNMKDYFSATDTMAAKPFIDEDRIGAVGASYGGFSVYWLAGHHEKRFKAFISHCGMFNLESQYNGTEEFFFVNHDLGGAYWEKDNKIAQKSYANSPHNFVDKWDTPILIISGENDFRIPYTESVQAFNAAQLNGVPSKLLIFPEECHFVLQPQNAVLWQREFKGWLDKWLK